jgi:hypothetical protein
LDLRAHNNDLVQAYSHQKKERQKRLEALKSRKLSLAYTFAAICEAAKSCRYSSHTPSSVVWVVWTVYLSFQPRLVLLVVFSFCTCALVTLYRHLAEGGKLTQAPGLFYSLLSRSLVTRRPSAAYPVQTTRERPLKVDEAKKNA